MKWEFEVEGLHLNFFGGIRYLWEYLGNREELEAWVQPQVEKWAHRVRIIDKISKQHPQSAYSGLGMLLQLEWKYLKRTIPGVGTLMGPIGEALRETFSPTIFREEEAEADFRKILGHSVKRGGLGIPDPRFSAESVYNISKPASGELVGSLLGGTNLKHVGHSVCINWESAGTKKDREYSEIEDLARQKDLEIGQERQIIHRATRKKS